MSNTSWKLPDDFYEKNPFDNNMTVGHLSYFRMKTMFDTDLASKMTEHLAPHFDDDRKAELEKEKDYIDSLSTPDEVVNYMRKVKETSNQHYLCRKAVDMGDKVAELLIEKLDRSGLDKFIECATQVLSKADEKYIDRVVKDFPQFRSGYARAQTTVLLAFRKRYDALESMYKEYMDFSRSSDSEDNRRADMVLFSIYILTGHLEEFENEINESFDISTGAEQPDLF